MEIITALGLIAGALTTFSFVPQVLKTWKFKETRDISLLMYIIFFTGILLWFTYGILIKNTPIIIANGISLVLVFIVLMLKIRYG
ncbi:MAG: PQ loop repeat protein [Candidatus Methanofastidiosum methylothiophilum]|uniref:PQ loop repeat protein n=1 Tax=Candidatus Methanofastidiosum methylothiophilum TaxID=1705564 RepID=A0A150JA03_9EURY|nr:MAG: PQ loop repeat protein [Candidatus Methanofastidiosum methylthiophilus]NMC76053.1 SemiSWEET transporter [Candidatus Methanofastidiosa archaeon]